MKKTIAFIVSFTLAIASICYGHELPRRHRTIYPSDRICYFVLGLPIGPYHRFEYDKISIIPIPEFAEMVDEYYSRRPVFTNPVITEKADAVPELRDEEEVITTEEHNPSLVPVVPESTITIE